MIGGMGGPEQNGGACDLAFEAYGVRMSVSASESAVLDRIRSFLPPGWEPCSASTVEQRFVLVADDFGRYSLTKGDEAPASPGLELDLVLKWLDSELRMCLGRTAPDMIFVHAGVVAHRGSTMVIPARSFGGKTTLVAALIRAGAVYYSDEYAVIDRDGVVHPYAKPFSLRGDGPEQTEHAVESLGGVAGDEPLPLGMIVITTYKAAAEWRPERLPPGAGAMALLAHAVPAQERPAETMHAISRAAEGAIVIESDRGEADEIATELLAEIERQAG